MEKIVTSQKQKEFGYSYLEVTYSSIRLKFDFCVHQARKHSKEWVREQNIGDVCTYDSERKQGAPKLRFG